MLYQLFNEDYFNRLIPKFEGAFKEYQEYDEYDNREKMQYALSDVFLDPSLYINVSIKDLLTTKKEMIKYKFRMNQICRNKLLIYILKTYPVEHLKYNKYLNMTSSDYEIKYETTDKALNKHFNEYFECYKYYKRTHQELYIHNDPATQKYLNYLEQYKCLDKFFQEQTSIFPSEPTIYDNELERTTNEYKTLLNKTINSQKKIVRWYKNQRQIRKARLILTTVYRLNQKQIKLPNDIIYNKIMRLKNY